MATPDLPASDSYVTIALHIEWVPNFPKRKSQDPYLEEDRRDQEEVQPHVPVSLPPQHETHKRRISLLCAPKWFGSQLGTRTQSASQPRKQVQMRLSCFDC